MKILYYHQHFSTPFGSTGTRSYEMARYFIRSGHSVTIVCGSYAAGSTGLTGSFSKGFRRGLVDGIDVIELFIPYSNYDGFLKRSLTFLRFAIKSTLIAFSEKYDLVFATSTPLTAGIPGIVASLLMRKKFVFEVRDLWPELPREMKVITNPLILSLMSVLEWLSYHTARASIGLSPGIVQGIKKRGIDPSVVHMIPNGCDFSLFGDLAEAQWRPEGVKTGDFMAVFAGTHGFANGLEVVVDAAKILKDRGLNGIKIVFVGDGKLKQGLVDRSQKLKLDNCIFNPPVSKVKLSGLLASADVGLMILANVSAFYYGTSPNKFFDYIASGIPIINNYPGWIADMIEANECGIVVPPQNADAIAEALEFLSNNVEKRKQMGINASVLAHKEFSRDVLAAKMTSILEKI